MTSRVNEEEGWTVQAHGPVMANAQLQTQEYISTYQHSNNNNSTWRQLRGQTG